MTELDHHAMRVRNRVENSPLTVLIREEFGFAFWFWWPQLTGPELEQWWRQIEAQSGERGAPYFFGPGLWPWPKVRVTTRGLNALWDALYATGRHYYADAHMDDDSALCTPAGSTILHRGHPDYAASLAPQLVAHLYTGWAAACAGGLAGLRALSLESEALAVALGTSWAEVPEDALWDYQWHHIELSFRALSGDTSGLVSFVLAWPLLLTLDHLDLGENGLTDEAFLRLVRAPQTQHLRELSVDGSALTDGVFRALVDPDVLPELHYLCVDTRHLDAGVDDMLYTARGTFGIGDS